MRNKNIQLTHEEISLDIKKHTSIHLVANKVELAGNIGSLFRIADAFGVDKLYLSKTSGSAST
jgi:tRNA G18 (ribose-2'-O)-methylase SpoU